jgi:hypothetical protein
VLIDLKREFLAGHRLPSSDGLASRAG